MDIQRSRRGVRTSASRQGLEIRRLPALAKARKQREDANTQMNLLHSPTSPGTRASCTLSKKRPIE